METRQFKRELVTQGYEKIKKYDYHGALICFDTFINGYRPQAGLENYQLTDAYIGKAKCLNALGKKIEALTTFAALKKIKPKQDTWMLSYAQILIDCDRSAEAVSVLNQYLDKPRNERFKVEALKKLARAYIKSQPAQAKTTIENLKNIGQDLETHLIEIEYEFSQDRTADDIFKQLMLQYNMQAFPKLYMKYICSLEMKKDYAGALKIAERLTQLHPEDNKYLIKAGFLAIKAGDEEKVEKYLFAALEADPQSKKALLYLAMYLERAEGDNTSSQAFLQKAVSYHPNSARLHLALSYSFYTHGKAGKLSTEVMQLATYHAQQAIALNPQYAAAHSQLGHCYDAVGNNKQASKCFKAANEIDRNRIHRHQDYIAQPSISLQDSEPKNYLAAVKKPASDVGAQLPLQSVSSPSQRRVKTNKEVKKVIAPVIEVTQPVINKDEIAARHACLDQLAQLSRLVERANAKEQIGENITLLNEINQDFENNQFDLANEKIAKYAKELEEQLQRAQLARNAKNNCDEKSTDPKNKKTIAQTKARHAKQTKKFAAVSKAAIANQQNSAKPVKSTGCSKLGLFAVSAVSAVVLVTGVYLGINQK